MTIDITNKYSVGNNMVQIHLSAEKLSAVLEGVEKELSELRKEVKKYRPMFAEWKRNKDKEQKKNNVFSEVVR